MPVETHEYHYHLMIIHEAAYCTFFSIVSEEDEGQGWLRGGMVSKPFQLLAQLAMMS